MSRLQFKIYIAGLNQRNKELVATFNTACADRFGANQYQIEVIDIITNTDAAELNKILATPTIIRENPLPRKRTIGDFKEIAKARMAVDFLIEDLTNHT